MKKINIKEILIRTFVSLFCFVVVYGMVAFYRAEIDFLQWRAIDRGMTIICSLAVSGIMNALISK